MTQYVIGHGFEFNGKTAWKTPDSPWEINNTNWVGSVACCFHRFTYRGAKLNPSDPIGSALIGPFGNTTFTSYQSHEESSVTNMTDTSIIGTFINQSNTPVAAYRHQYREGNVIGLCIFGDDIIGSDQSAQYFLVQSLSFGSKNIQAPHDANNKTTIANSNSTTKSGSPSTVQLPSNSLNIQKETMLLPLLAAAITIGASALILVARRLNGKRIA